MENQLTCLVLTPRDGWFETYAHVLCESLRSCGHLASVSNDIDSDASGDICFVLSWESLVRSDFRGKFDHSIVVHASELPEGRGWSPLTWQVLEGRTELPLTLFEAVDAVDAGPVYIRSSIQTSGLELIDQLRDLLGSEIVRMCLEFTVLVEEDRVLGEPQEGRPTFYRRRTPSDSQLNPDMTIRDQFNLLRVVDNDRYPAFFEIGDAVYELRISRRDKPTSPLSSAGGSR